MWDILAVTADKIIDSTSQDPKFEFFLQKVCGQLALLSDPEETDQVSCTYLVYFC